MMKIDEIENKIRNEASTVLWHVLLFIIYYVALFLAGIGLLAAAFGFSLLLFKSIGGVWTAVILWFSLQIAWYLIKPLFAVHKTSKENNQEIHREDCPELFSIIEDIANKTGNKMPKHIYLSAELNARVFYNSMNIWSIFLPTSKNLMIGTELLYGMSNDELKAILAHEFGHFSQQTMKISSVTYRLNNSRNDRVHPKRTEESFFEPIQQEFMGAAVSPRKLAYEVCHKADCKILQLHREKELQPFKIYGIRSRLCCLPYCGCKAFYFLYMQTGSVVKPI